MACTDTGSNFIGWVQASVTLAAVGVALFQERIKEIWNTPNLRIKIFEKHGRIVSDTAGINVLYYHLELLNGSSCRALKPSIYVVAKRDLNGRVKRIAPLRLGWAHEAAHKETAVGPETEFPEWNLCDLLELPTGQDHVRLSTVFGSTDLSQNIAPSTTVSIFLRIFASNYSQPNLTEVKIEWDGQRTPFDIDNLKKHLIVTTESRNDLCEQLFTRPT